MRVRIFIDEFIERLVLRFRLLVFESAVQTPAHDQRPEPTFVQQRERFCLTPWIGHACMNADAISDPCIAQHADKPRRQHDGVAQFNRIATFTRQRRQRVEERGQALEECGWIDDQRIRQRRNLEHERAGFFTQTGDARLHEFIDGNLRVQERGVVAGGGAFVATDGGIGDGSGRLDDEAEVRRHLVRIARVVGYRQRPVERTVYRYTSQQRMRAERAEAIAGQFLGRVFVAVDDVTPAGKRPRRWADMNGVRKTLRQRVMFRRGGSGQNSGA